MTTFRFLGQQFERVRSWRFRRKGSRGERYDRTTAGGGVALDAALDELVGRSSDHGGIRCMCSFLVECDRSETPRRLDLFYESRILRTLWVVWGSWVMPVK